MTLLIILGILITAFQVIQVFCEVNYSKLISRRVEATTDLYHKLTGIPYRKYEMFLLYCRCICISGTGSLSKS